MSAALLDCSLSLLFNADSLQKSSRKPLRQGDWCPPRPLSEVIWVASLAALGFDTEDD